mgnify:FL=1|tara:strand:- start:1759 stop:2370 length:612 start_codon:yes stop_codon:yes gene_type:complete
MNFSEIKLMDENFNEPLIIFTQWFNLANKKEINDANAMNVSTISHDKKPSSRMILLKEYDENGFIFNTNIESRKSQEINYSNYIALNFYWKSIRRQIRIEGKAYQLNNSEADKIFENRPRESQIAAWASKQSHYLPNRQMLNKRIFHFENLFNNSIIERPKFWSGYRVIPEYYEFWWDVKHRLHYRVVFKKKNGSWTKLMLYP